MKNGMKQTEIGEIPVEWKVMSIAEFAEILNSKRVPLSSETRFTMKGEYPYCGANGVVGSINDYKYDGLHILMAEDGGNFHEFETRPITYLMDGKFWVNNHAHVLRAKNKEHKFLHYSLVHKDITKYIIGSTRTKLNRSVLEKIKIAVPPLPEQRKIAEILSTLDEKMAVMDEQLTQTQELKKGLIQRLLTKGIGHSQFKDSPLGEIPASWEVACVDEIADIKTGAKDTQNKDEFGEYPFFVRSQTIERINSYAFDGEAILTAGDGVGVGKVFHYVNGKFDYHQRVYNVHNFAPKMYGLFFFEFFKENFMHRVRKYNAKGSVDSVRREMISKMSVPLPPLPEQRQIAEILTTVDEKIGVLQDKKAQYQTLKRGLMQQLLTGQRRVRVPALETAALV